MIQRTRPAPYLITLLVLAACQDRSAQPVRHTAEAPAATASRPPAAPDSVLEQVLAWDDTVRLIRDTVDAPPGMAIFRLRVGPRVVLEEEVQGMRIYAMVPDPDSVGTLLVIQVVPGGTGCEAQYAVLEVGDSALVSDTFGDCGAFPRLTLLPDRLRLYFYGWLPTAVETHPEDYPNAHADPETWEYRHGRLRKLAN